MSLVTRTLNSGLLVAETRGEEAALRRALKRLDDQLILEPPGTWTAGDAGPSPYWKVLRYVAGDKKPEPLLVWMDADMNPLPLSMGILDEVQKHRKDRPNQGPTADERNARLTAANRKDTREQIDQISDEYAPYLDRGRTGVSMGARNRVPYYQRRFRGGYR